MPVEMLGLAAEMLRACSRIATVLAVTNWIILIAIFALCLRKKSLKNQSLTLLSVCLLCAGVQVLAGLALACARCQFLFVALVPESMSYGQYVVNPGLTYLGFVNSYWWSISPFVLSGINLVVAFGIYVFSGNAIRRESWKLKKVLRVNQKNAEGNIIP